MPAALLQLHRPRPARDADLLAARHAQRAGGRAFGDGAAAAHCAAGADGDGRHQHAVAADMHVGFDHGAVFVGAVVIRRDAAGAVVDAFADRGVAQIRQVVGLCAFGER